MPAVVGAAGRRRGMRARVLTVLALAAAGVAGSATAASAHATLDSTSPRAGAVVQGRVQAVRLTFDEAVGTPAFIAVTGPQGRVDTGGARVDGAVVSVGLKDSLPAGRYSVAFRVVSDDGHPVESSYTFQVKAAAAPSPAASASTGGVAPSLSASATPGLAPAPAPAAAAVATAPAEAAGEQDHSSHWFMGVAGVAMVLAGAGALVWERRHRSEGDEEQELVATSGGDRRS
jgi:methionine-rich copper-binding protein CopC